MWSVVKFGCKFGDTKYDSATHCKFVHALVLCDLCNWWRCVTKCFVNCLGKK
jgi:hypothetical protein